MKQLSVATGVTVVVDEFQRDSTLPVRQQEQMAVSRVLTELLPGVVLRHNDSGKPLVDGYEISISHSVSSDNIFVAVMLSKDKTVGVDIEYKSDRIMKVVSRFLRKDEDADTVESALVHWCAKEAVFKLFSDDELTYQEMRVNKSLTLVENLKRHVTVDIHAIMDEKYTLVYTFSKCKQ